MVIMVMLGIKLENGGEIDEDRLSNAFEIITPFVIIPSALAFYSFYLVLFPLFLKKKKVLQALIFGPLMVSASVAIGFAITPQRFIDTCGTENGEDTVFTMLFFMFFASLVCGVIALIIQGFVTWMEEIKLKESLKEKNREMEMALVKAQQDPHFLFNTINNIDVLISRDPSHASDYLNKLSHILRFMLYENKTDQIPLSKEIEYIEKYIELQKIRTANANYVNFTVKGNPAGVSIAPMLFIPFIENAFKHTTNKKLDNAIDIKLDIKERSIDFECTNKFDPNRVLNQDSNGLGNDLIEKRLKLLYPDQHKLELVRSKDLYQASLTIWHD